MNVRQRANGHGLPRLAWGDLQMFRSGTWRCSPRAFQVSITQIHTGRLTRADHPQGPLALEFSIFAILSAFKCIVFQVLRHRGGRFPGICAKTCRSLFSEWLSKGTESRQDTAITLVLVPLRAAMATPLPSCHPAPPLSLLIFTISRQTHRRCRWGQRGGLAWSQHGKQPVLPGCCFPPVLWSKQGQVKNFLQHIHQLPRQQQHL